MKLSVNPIVYEGGETIFIDSEYETWNVSPKALEKAFEIYPDVRLVVFVVLTTLRFAGDVIERTGKQADG